MPAKQYFTYNIEHINLNILPTRLLPCTFITQSVVKGTFRSFTAVKLPIPHC
ncbi:hypothetical protein FQN60_018314 [Etheostoma spectabile]|uniref:Uncharacterized protein n=1 Tax=Etheostoma spectabile TaxID=54343 RepID=A0A5J5DHW1_9PERO|nr:hypothetical protein FQN60_018314 [Etheostoma spectabile]